MDDKEMIEKFGLSDADMDKLAEQYESDEVAFDEGDQVFVGSPLDYVGPRRETFVIGADEMQKVRALAKKQKRTKSEIYRDAVRQYLAAAGML